MKAIFKGNKFTIQWAITDAVTSLPFDFTGMFVEFVLYSDSYHGRISGATVSGNKMQAEIPADTLPVGIYNIVCDYRTRKENHGHCICRRAFQITRNPEFVTRDDKIVLESFAAPLQLENMDINYIGHYPDGASLPDQDRPAWALAGNLKEAKPWFFYTAGSVPPGYQAGWNDLSDVLGTYDLTADKVSIYDFNLVTEYNVSRNHVHTTKVFSKDWSVTTKYYTEFADYISGKTYAPCSKVNMPGYKEHSFMANKATSEAPFTIVDGTNEFSFSESVALVPKEYRFAGMRVTFINSMTHLAETWYFNGGTWENVGNWQKIDFGVGEDQLTAEELFKEKFEMPKLIADMAIADEHGNRIPDTYVKRQTVANYIKSVYQELFIANPPLITEGYITPEMLSEETKQMLEATGQEITNLPDGEDLQSVHGVLKFANKEYNPNSYSGLGKRILRKNIVAGVNVLTQSMMQWPNTIYVIQYDYDLNGAEITIPEGCVLDFQGGSLNNGTIVGNNTTINSLNSIIFLNIKFKGTYVVSYITSNWFKNYSYNDLFEAISILSNSNINTYINIEKFNIEDLLLDDRYNTTVHVNTLYKPSKNTTTDFNNSTIKVLVENQFYVRVLWVNAVDNIVIRNVNIIGDAESNTLQSEFSHGVYIDSSSNITFENCNISKMCGDGLGILYSSHVTIDNVNFDANGRNNISIVAGDNLFFNHCNIINAGTINGKLPMAGIDIEPNDVEQRNSLKNIKFIDCSLKGNVEWDISYLTDGTVKHNFPDAVLEPFAEDTIVFENCTMDSFVGSANWGNGYTIKNSVINKKIHSIATNSKIINCIIPSDYSGDETINFISVNNKQPMMGQYKWEGCYKFGYMSKNQVLKIRLMTPNDLLDCHLAIKIESDPNSNHFVKNIAHYYMDYSKAFIKTLDELQDSHIDRSVLLGTKAYSLAVSSEKSILEEENVHTFYIKNINANRNLNGVIYISAESTRNNIQLYGLDIVDISKVPSDVSFKLNLSPDKVILDYYGDLDTVVAPYMMLYKGLSVFIQNQRLVYNGSKWLESDGAEVNVTRYGSFDDKPTASKIYPGFRYFCTNRQTEEGGVLGIEIIYKHTEHDVDVWVDALGRIVE